MTDHETDTLERSPSSPPELDQLVEEEPGREIKKAGELAVEGARLVEVTSLLDLLPSALAGGRLVADVINGSRPIGYRFKVPGEDEQKAMLDDWLTDEISADIDYARSIDPNTQATLIAPPDTLGVVEKKGGEIYDTILLTVKELELLIGQFNGRHTNISSPIHRLFSSYSEEQLAKTDPTSSQNSPFKLVLSSHIIKVTGNNIQERQRSFAALREAMPSLKALSPLDALTFYLTLLARGGLDTRSLETFDLTRVIHLGLPEIKHEGHKMQPASGISNFTGTYLGSARSKDEGHSVVMLG